MIKKLKESELKIICDQPKEQRSVNVLFFSDSTILELSV